MKVKLIKLESTERYQRLFGKDSGTSGMKAGHVILKPGEDIGEHSTGGREEAIIILKGKGEAIVGRKESLYIEKDMALYIPPETAHNIKNTGPGIFEYIFITSPI